MQQTEPPLSDTDALKSLLPPLAQARLQSLRLADGAAKHESRCGEVARAQLEVRGVDPKLAKRKRLVRNDSQGSLADRASAYYVAAVQLLEHGVLDPQKHVAPPRALFGTGWDLGNTVSAQPTTPQSGCRLRRARMRNNRTLVT